MKNPCNNLLASINRGDLAEVKSMIDAGVDLGDPCDDGATPLFAAVLNGHESIVRLMLERGADPNFTADEPAASCYAEKPLCLAQQARFLMDWDKFHSIVETLLEYGATDSDGNGPIPPDHLAVIRQRAREHGGNKSA